MGKPITRMLSIILIFFVIGGCQNLKPKEQDLMHIKSSDKTNSKKIIMLLADSLMAQAIDQGVREKQLPTFQFLIDRGQYYKNVVSSFPTMSVTIDSSLLTGTYPDAHHVPGLTWYSSNDQRVINYGTGPMEVMKQGINPVLADALIHLNQTHLNPQVPTIYEDLARRGLKSGSINGLIYRGTTDHTLSLPAWIHGPTTLPKNIQVKGPDFLALASLSNPFKGMKDLPTGLTKQMGLNNRYSIEAAKYLINTGKLPDFLYVYLPDLDRQLHKNGPFDLKGVKELDGQLLSLLQAFGTPEEALQKAIIMIVGDSGMSQLLPTHQNPVIDLPVLLQDLNVLRPGETVTDRTDIVLAVNETMAYIYPLKTDPPLSKLAEQLKSDPRIDIIAWKEGDWVRIMQGTTAKQMKYKRGGHLTDPYNQKWTIEQSYDVLDITVNPGNRTVQYGQYPDALQRLLSALNSHRGPFLVVTAKQGYELADRSSPTHKGGGGHGSFHQTESLVPLIICGTEQKPKYLRLVDLKPYLLHLLQNDGAP